MAGKSKRLQALESQLKTAASRLADQHLNLAVTGLSKSGKSAFITSLVNQLLEASGYSHLSFFSVCREQRLHGCMRQQQPDITVPRFEYEQAIKGLQADTPVWPPSTTGVSQIRLKLRFRRQQGLRKLVSEDATLTLDITDYPGEWLLDLPLLELSYQQWCEQFWQQLTDPARVDLAEAFLQQVGKLDINSEADEAQLQALSTTYADYLERCQQAGYQLVQPGRFLLPGDLAGAPVLQFFPLTREQFEQRDKDSKNSCYRVLKERFGQYKSKVVKPFYRQHFSRFDRQIVLTDCLTALNRGPHSVNDLQQAINWLLSSFHYGKSSILRRLFSPRIDKLVFAASKADHVSSDQQDNLVRLLGSIVRDARHKIQFEGVKTESTAIASIRASQAGTVNHDGEQLNVIRGKDLDGNAVTLFPGDVPRRCPDADFWRKQGFAFPQLSAPSIQPDQALPHIRMDQILEFVLADKMR